MPPSDSGCLRKNVLTSFSSSAAHDLASFISSGAEEDSEPPYAEMIRTALLKLPGRQGNLPTVCAYIEVCLTASHPTTAPSHLPEHNRRKIGRDSCSSEATCFVRMNNTSLLLGLGKRERYHNMFPKGQMRVAANSF